MNIPTELQQAAQRELILSGIEGQFWQWLRREILAEKQNAINDLTNIDPIPDNLGKIAAAQERLRFATVLAKRPYDLLGISEPR